MYMRKILAPGTILPRDISESITVSCQYVSEPR